MRILSIIGARPQFIKAAALSRSILEHPNISEIILHTGQHFDDNMSEIFFREMEIPNPDYNLGIQGGSHGAMTGKMLEGIEKIAIKEKPDLVLTYGDTNSTLAGALSASKLGIPTAHVEAGLRSFNMAMPEEINRILTDRISNYLFCPTQTSVDNLKKEGFENFNCSISNVGDIMYEAALFYGQKSDSRSTIINSLGLESFALATFHRQENTDRKENLQGIINALNSINKRLRVVCPIHPRTRQKIESLKIQVDFDMIDPVGYFDMLELIKNSELVLTDSGGLQKEAYFFSRYCITMREQTEWVELVHSGVNILTGASEEKIKSEFENFTNKELNFSEKLYGDGKTSKSILDSLSSN